MKRLNLQGTQEQFEYLYKNINLEDKDKDLLPFEVETRVYVLDILGLRGLPKPHATLTTQEFMDLAEEEGNVYTLKGFQDAFNNEDVNSESHIIKFINVIKL